MNSLISNRETSDRFQLLNGNWKFKYYHSIYDLKEHFFEEDFDAASFDTIPVPSVWQNHGYDSHQYTNIKHPFPFDPPYVPHDNPCGAYITNFTYHKDPHAPQAYLNFEGVDSCFYVWINGNYVGFSKVSHATSEFDVTKFLNEGQNKLAVLVLKWCDGSYLEDHFKETAKLLISNKYYLMICSTYILMQIYTATLNMGIYFMTYVLGNANLLGVFSWAINIPVIAGLIFTPILVQRFGGMFKLNLGGYALAIVFRGLVLVAGYMGNIPLMLVFTALASNGDQSNHHTCSVSFKS